MIGVPNNLNLDTLDVFYEDSAQEFFSVQGLDYPLSYGKHLFTLSYQDVKHKNFQIAHDTKILFEIKDSNGILLNSGVTDYDAISGAGACYIWVEEKLQAQGKNSKTHIADGTAILTIVGELENVPQKWKDKYNIKCIYEFDIRKGFYNKSDIIFYKKPHFNISESVEIDKSKTQGASTTNIKRSYGILTIDNLLTWAGKVDYAEIYHKSEYEKSEQYTLLDSFKLTDRGSDQLVNSLRHTNYLIAGEITGTKTIGDFATDLIGGMGQNEGFLKYYEYSGSHISHSSILHLHPDKRGTTGGLQGSMVFKRPADQPTTMFYRWISDRKACDDEVLDFKYTISGSLSVNVYSAQTQQALDFTTAVHNETGSNIPVKIFEKHYIDNKASQSYSFGPLVDGEYRTDLVGEYYESNQITIPSASYISVTFYHTGSARPGIAGINDTGSLKKVSLKERPPIGTNPNTYFHKFPLKQSRRDDLIFYKLQFLNPDKKPVQVLSSSVAERYSKDKLDSKFELELPNLQPKRVVGAPLVIEKNDNLITGSLKIGLGLEDSQYFAEIGYDSDRKTMTFEKDTDPTTKGETTDRIVFSQSGSRSSIHISGSHITQTSLIVSSGSTSGPTAITIIPRNIQFVNPDHDVAGVVNAVKTFTIGTATNRGSKFFISPGNHTFPVNTDSRVGIMVSGSQGIDGIRVGIRKLEPEATLHVGGDLKVDGNIQATQFTASIISASVIYSSGSNIFGDENGSADTHQFFGHITASGDISSSGKISSRGIILDSGNIGGLHNNNYMVLARNGHPGASSATIGAFGFMEDTGTGGGGTYFRVINREFINAGTSAHFSVGTIGTSGVQADNQALVAVGKELYPAGVQQKAMFSVGGTIEAESHITASGNISASGDLFIGDVTIDGNLGFTQASAQIIDDGGDERIDFNSGDTHFNAGQQDIDFKVESTNATPLFVDAVKHAVAIGFQTPVIPSGMDTGLTVFGAISSSGFISTKSHITASGNVKVAGNILANGNIVGDDNTTITQIASIALDNILDDASEGDTDIGLTDTTLNIQVGGAANIATTAVSTKFLQHITASLNISASGNIFGSALLIGGESFATLLNGNQAQFAIDSQITKISIGKAAAVTETTIEGHITASGNISSSGTITANKFVMQNGAFIDGINNKPDVFFSSGIKTTTHITASGNISASGDIFGNELTVLDNINLSTNKKITFADDNQYIQGNTTQLILESDNQLLMRADEKVAVDTPKFYIGSGITAVAPKTLTVLGDISASGDLFAGSTTGAYISSSAGNLEISGSGDGAAQIIISGSSATLMTVFSELSGSIFEVKATQGSGSLTLSGSMVLKPNTQEPAISQSRLFNSSGQITDDLHFGDAGLTPAFAWVSLDDDGEFGKLEYSFGSASAVTSTSYNMHVSHSALGHTGGTHIYVQMDGVYKLTHQATIQGGTGVATFKLKVDGSVVHTKNFTVHGSVDPVDRSHIYVGSISSGSYITGTLTGDGTDNTSYEDGSVLMAERLK